MNKYPRSPKEVAVIMESSEAGLDMDQIILECWANCALVSEATTDFTRKPIMRGTWNVASGVVRTLASSFWNIVMTPISAAVDLALGTDDAGPDALVALKQTIKGIAETAYGFAQLGYGGIKALRDFASVAANNIRREAGEALGDDAQEAIEQGAQAAEGKIIKLSDQLENRLAA